MTIKKPIFIVGAGRSGTTILYNLLSTHSELCWFSNYISKYPHFKQLFFLNKLLDVPFLGIKLRSNIIYSKGPKFSIKPVEADRIYHNFCGFIPSKKMTENDFDKNIDNKFKELIRDCIRMTGNKRFINKQTSNIQRIRLLNVMFPDAQYVHIIRDGRAVANSLLNVSWWNDNKIWWLGKKPPDWQARGKDPIELCALSWRKNVEEILVNKHLFSDRYIEIRYEELVKNVKKTIFKITDFCMLKRSKTFENLLPASLTNMNHKWETSLSHQQKQTINNSVGNFLSELGYQ
jgi:hypothetical protein